MKTTLPIKPFACKGAEGINHNVLQVRVDYDKQVKGPRLWLATGEREGDPKPGELGCFFRCSLFGSPSSNVVLERNWPRNNAKRLEAAWDQVLAELARKSGPAWEAITALLTPVGSGLVGDEPAAAPEPAPHVPLREQIPGLDAALAAHRGDAPAFLFG